MHRGRGCRFEGTGEDGLGGGHDTAHTKLGVHEGATHEVHAVVRGVGARFGGIGHGLRGEALKVKERVRKMIEAIRDTSCSRFRDKDNMRPIMQEGGTQVEGAGAVLVPRFSLDGRVVDDDQLAWGWVGWAAKLLRLEEAQRAGL